ncbi:Larval cuticle protein LCP-22 [Amphibalanus amphitrite]|uniref:Larval cuticle protein LCP-22 n=1 Tax=Amphibalanus amphitrite TaxID=1232801 RepID=A0A6A4X0J6_AMPAM|nr:larval cuticle protein 65Ag1-like [Amphibalanus amphitrite]KAF0311733.1 Larval cuticle protein LCP-22 [Amphibalanus amphitrite]
MKLVVFFAVLVAAAARPQGDGAELLRYESQQNEDGSFQYNFETSDPILVDSAGQQRQIGDQAGIVMQGSYTFRTPEGQQVTIDWVADEKGFQPRGDAIPVAPQSS